MYRSLLQLFPLMKDVLKKADLLDESVKNLSLKILLWKDLKNYKRVWEDHYKNKNFHFRLRDQSLFRFLFFNRSISFEFLDCPYDIEELYLESEEYEDYLPTPIRYDYEPKIYNEISHPIGHIHLGLENQIRIGTCCLFNPLSFLLFCLRQMYPEHWKKIIENSKFEQCRKNIREEISQINDEHKLAYNREHFII